MPRSFTDAKELLGDLLDRYEGGTASPIGYPHYSAFADVSEIDRFVRKLEEVEAAGAIRIAKGRGRNGDQIAHVRLEAVSRLYDLLGRRPVGEHAAEASGRLLDGLDLPNEFEAPIAAIRAAWDRGRAWQGFAARDAERLRIALLLAKAILEDKHRGVDYRTFSRRIAGDSKALEKVEGAVVNWTTVKTAKAQWLREGKVKVILQVLTERGPDLPDVPALGELGDTPEAKQLLGLYASTSAVGRAFFAPPGLSPTVTKALRDGFTAMSKDPQFVADANQINAELQVGSGEEVQKAVERTLNVPEPVLQRAREIFAR